MAVNIDTERRATVHEQMCKSAFVKNIKRSGSCGSRLSGVRKRRTIALTADVAYQMVMDLSRIRSQQNQEQRVSSELAVCNNTSSDANTESVASSSSISSTPAKPLSEQRYNGFCVDYDLGDAVRCPSDMIVEATQGRTTDAVVSLRKHDFAWVKRSDGSYTYSIIADKTEDHIVFLIDSKGSTKKVSRKHWSELVRRVQIVSSTAVARVVEPGSRTYVYRVGGEPFRLPEAIALKRNDMTPLFVTFDAEDDISIISDVSLPNY